MRFILLLPECFPSFCKIISYNRSTQGNTNLNLKEIVKHSGICSKLTPSIHIKCPIQNAQFDQVKQVFKQILITKLKSV